MPDERGVWTAAELEKLPPAERDAIIRSGISFDPTEAPPHLLERARDKAAARIAATEGTQDAS
jgi:hypothetical protein